MNILAVDVGTHTGWASYLNGMIESGMKDFSLKRGDSVGMRFYNFNNWLHDFIQGRLFDLIVYEQPHHRGGYATEVLVGMTTRIQEIADINNIEYCSVHTGALKKFTTGKGNASKGDMINWFKRRVGRHPITDDEADALALLYWAFNEYNVRGKR